MNLNFFTATQAHMKWKTRLLNCVCNDVREELDPAVIALDNRCDLGKWLYVIRDQNRRVSPETGRLFTRLLQEHSDFHKIAAQTVELSIAGQKDEALKNLQGGDYSRISNKVIGSLGELYLKRKEFGMA